MQKHKSIYCVWHSLWNAILHFRTVEKSIHFSLALILNFNYQIVEALKFLCFGEGLNSSLAMWLYLTFYLESVCKVLCQADCRHVQKFDGSVSRLLFNFFFRKYSLILTVGSHISGVVSSELDWLCRSRFSCGIRRLQLHNIMQNQTSTINQQSRSSSFAVCNLRSISSDIERRNSFKCKSVPRIRNVRRY